MPSRPSRIRRALHASARAAAGVAALFAATLLAWALYIRLAEPGRKPGAAVQPLRSAAAPATGQLGGVPVSQLLEATLEVGAGVGDGHAPSDSSFAAISERSRCFWILPVAVIGSTGVSSSRSGSFCVATLCSRR